MTKNYKVRPLDDKVLVRPISREERTKSGIVIPDTATKERPEEGEILVVGPGRLNEGGVKRIPMSVKPGDKILFEKYGPKEVRINEEELLIIKEGDILAIMED